MKKHLLFLLLAVVSSYNAQEWKFLTPVKSYSTISNLEVTPNQTLYLVDNANQFGIVASSADGGQTWRKLFRSGGYVDMQMLNNQTGFVLRQHGIYKTTDAFATSEYKNVSSDFLKSFYFVNESTGFVCGNNGVVYKTMNSGTTFSPVSLTDHINLNDIFFINSMTGFVCAANGKVYKTTDQGATWTSSTLSSTSLNKMVFINDTVGFIAGNNGKIFKTVDQGANWTSLSSTAIYHLYDIKFNAGQLYTVGQDNRLLKSTDLGLSWAEQRLINVYPYQDLYSIGFLNGEILAGGVSNVYKSANGTNWTVHINGIYPSSLKNITFSDSNHGVIVGNENFYSVVYQTNDGGHTWNNKKATFNTNSFVAADMKASGKALLVGNGTYYLSTDFGQTWTTAGSITPTVSYSACWLKNNGDFFIGTTPSLPMNDGLILKTSAGWSQFTNIPQVRTIQFYNDMVGYAGAEGKLYKTTNGGLAWNQAATVFGNVSYINIVNANRIDIGTTTGYRYTSNNGGTSWTQVDQVNKPNFHFFDEQNGYGFDTGFNLHKTTNGGVSWQQIVPGSNYFDSYITDLNNFKYFPDKIIAIGDYSDIYLLDLTGFLKTDELVSTGADQTMAVYPNPTSSLLYFKSSVKHDKIELFDAQGRIQTFTKHHNGINVSHLPTGIYFLKFESNGKMITQKIIKQ